MPERDDIIAAARGLLVGQSLLGREDTCLLDHALRTLRCADVILEFDEVRPLRVDRLCLDAATMFHDAALVRLERERRESPVYAAATMSTDEIHGYSAELAGDALRGVLNERQIARTQEIIRQFVNRVTPYPEALILSDACNLDDLGVIGLWREARHFALDGGAVADLLESWQRRLDYGYFTARIKDTFRFAESRRWAETRLKRLEQFMLEMVRENRAADPRRPS